MPLRIARAAVCLLALLLPGSALPDADPALTVAISLDLPPYVMQHAASGLEVDLVQRALPGRPIHFVQMPYARIQTAVPEGRADAAVGVQHFRDDGVSYSRDFVTFENAAITKKAAGLGIGSVADLAGHEVLAWEDAYLELGPDFEREFAPGSPQRGNYVEVGDQREQVERFWDAPADVIVIDRNVFDSISAELGHSTAQVAYHSLFPPVTDFKVGFRDAALRDAFDRGLAELCSSGGYGELLERYRVELPRTICDR